MEPKFIDPDLKKGFFILPCLIKLLILLLPRSSLASSDHGNDFLKHEHLSPLGTKLRFTSSFHAETTKQLSGSTGPQHKFLAWNQKPSAKKALAHINSHTSALGTQHLSRELPGQHSCRVQPTDFPKASEEEDAALQLGPTHTHIIISAGSAQCLVTWLHCCSSTRGLSALAGKLSPDPRRHQRGVK